MLIKKLELLLLLINLISLQACTPPVIIGAGARGRLVAKDRHSAGTFIDEKNLSIKPLHHFKKDHELWSNSHKNPVIDNKNFNMMILRGKKPILYVI